MKKLLSFLKQIFPILIVSFCIVLFFDTAFADETAGMLGGSGITGEKLRNGDITMADISIMIVSIIEFLLALAGSISVVALIYHAVHMQLSSGITGDSSGVDKAKKGMKGALLGFVVSMSAWFLMTKFIELLSSST